MTKFEISAALQTLMGRLILQGASPADVCNLVVRAASEGAAHLANNLTESIKAAKAPTVIDNPASNQVGG